MKQQRQSDQKQHKEKELKAALDESGSAYADGEGKRKSDRWEVRARYLEQYRNLAELGFRLTGNIKLAMQFHGQEIKGPPNDIDREFHYEAWFPGDDINVKVLWEKIFSYELGIIVFFFL